MQRAVALRVQFRRQKAHVIAAKAASETWGKINGFQPIATSKGFQMSPVKKHCQIERNFGNFEEILIFQATQSTQGQGFWNNFTRKYAFTPIIQQAGGGFGLATSLEESSIDKCLGQPKDTTEKACKIDFEAVVTGAHRSGIVVERGSH